MNGWFIAGAILVFIAIGFFSKDNSEAGIYIGIFGIVLFLIGFIEENTTNREKECRDRGGQVVHYGRLGEGVDCIFVSK